MWSPILLAITCSFFMSAPCWGHNHGGRDHGGWDHGGWDQGGWDQGGRDQGGWGRGEGHHHGGPRGGGPYGGPDNTNCIPTSNRVIVINDDNFNAGTFNNQPNCLGSCIPMPNSVLVDIASLNLNKNDSLVLMIGPKGSPNNITDIIKDSNKLITISEATNLYISTEPLRTDETDQLLIENTNKGNEMVKALANEISTVHLLDFNSFYNEYLKYANGYMWTQGICTWIHTSIAEKISTESGAETVPTDPTVPVEGRGVKEGATTNGGKDLDESWP